MITVMGFDPGPKNFGFAVCQYRQVGNASVQWRALRAGIIQNPINDVKTITEQVAAFANEVDGFILDFKPNYIILERFMTRGLKGTAIEYISIMIGVLVDRMRVHGVNILIVQAATWKVPFKRLHNLEEIYKYALCQTHEIDASLLTAYMASKVFNIKVFSFFDKASTIAHKVENVSTGQKHKRRRIATLSELPAVREGKSK